MIMQKRNWSGREDSNLRPSAPKADALPGCATPRSIENLPVQTGAMCIPGRGKVQFAISPLLYQSSQLLTLMAGFHELAGVILLTT